MEPDGETDSLGDCNDPISFVNPNRVVEGAGRSSSLNVHSVCVMFAPFLHGYLPPCFVLQPLQP